MTKSQLPEPGAAGETTDKGEDGSRSPPETPFLLLYDVHHWHGREGGLRGFVRAVKRAGRSALIVALTEPMVADELSNTTDSQEENAIRHAISLRDALALGAHLNRFLAPYGRQKTQAQWRGFWESHGGGVVADIASFWITLSFWLKGQIEIDQSIQAILQKQLEALDLSRSAMGNLLKIAAMSIERQPLSEALLTPAEGKSLPLCTQLQQAATELPALGLVTDQIGTERRWGLVHDLLGRLFLNAVINDKSVLRDLGYQSIESLTEFRLELLRGIANQGILGTPKFRSVGVEFAARILKLDPKVNAELLHLWRSVLDVLDSMPENLQKTSRTFNHHVAISRRRVATSEHYLVLDALEKKIS